MFLLSSECVNHCLPIEKSAGYIDRNGRMCNLCQLNEIDDEFQCSKQSINNRHCNNMVYEKIADETDKTKLINFAKFLNIHQIMLETHRFSSFLFCQFEFFTFVHFFPLTLVVHTQLDVLFLYNTCYHVLSVQ